MLVFKSRIKETTTTTGTGPYSLLGAATGFRSFSVIGGGNQTWYTITDGTNWETGVGTYAGGNLSRDRIYSSSTGSAINWGAGTKTIFATEIPEVGTSNSSALVKIQMSTLFR